MSPPCFRQISSIFLYGISFLTAKETSLTMAGNSEMGWYFKGLPGKDIFHPNKALQNKHLGS